MMIKIVIFNGKTVKYSGKMNKFDDILFDIWRAVSRHIRLNRCISEVSNLLLPHLPVEQIYVLKWEEPGSHWQVLAKGFEWPGPEKLQTKVFSRAETTRIKKWVRKQNVLHLSQSANAAELLPLFSLDRMRDRDALIAAIGERKNSDSVIILVSKEKQLFDAHHVELFKILIEPFSAAVENDHLFRDLERQKEAAEADKKSLLNKLSRNDIVDTIIGKDGGLRTVIERIALVADSDVPVLIFGETGTGKELIARTLHNRSNRSDGPFIRVNCGAIPPELLDSQLFGHERGAFTGAIATRKGWFEQADGGTLFLDEVGELSLEAQVRLLRVIQDGWLERVGGKEPLHVNIRIVLATHRDLSLMVSEGRFREDLWYRIATFPVVLPPLRERLDDLKPLAEHFAGRSSIRFGLPLILPNDEDIQLLASYSWPGNIRELASIIDRAALLGNGRCLEVSKSLGLTSSLENRSKSAGRPEIRLIDDSTILPLEEVNRRHILKALHHSGGRIEGRNGAAAILEINPNTLRARMKKLGISWKNKKIDAGEFNNQMDK